MIMTDNTDILSGHRPPKSLAWLIHAFGWGLFLLFPFFASNRHSEAVEWADYLRFFVNFLTVAAVFYLNYLYLVKRFMFRRQMLSFVMVNFIIFTVLVVATHFLMDIIPPPSNPGRRPKPDADLRYIFIAFDYIKYTFAAVFSIAFRMTGSWYKADAERRELEKSRSEAELQSLKQQLNPHFLFNTLNNIYSLIAISSDRAQEAVHELSRLLRYMLYESNSPKVTIDKDLAFINNYVELMRIRMPGNMDMKAEILTSSPATEIAPLMLITLVENAFKHGVSNSKPSFIHININADDKEIACDITNSFFPKNEADKSGSGIGLANLHKRLELLYPGRYTFTYGREGDIYRSLLKIQLP